MMGMEGVGGGCEEECVTVRRYVCGVLGVEV